jgi:hypothetical protein
MDNTRSACWVVYQSPIRGRAGLTTAVCEQAEWDAMELARPGYHTLVRNGIGSEAEAEMVARNTLSAAVVASAATVTK